VNAAVITPICSAAVTIVLGVLGYLRLRLETKGVKADVGDVHALVNSQLATELDRNDQLTRTLTAAGVDVPERPEQPPEPPGTGPRPAG
jgi:hypothetical protein